MTVGRLAVQKCHRYLLEAMPALLRRVPGMVAVVAGDGHLRNELETRAGRLGVDHAFRLIGHRPDARDLLDAADAFVLPSRQEGMPLAALEAMEAGLPVVATDVIGTAEVVLDGVTGLLVPSGDSDALAVALAQLLDDEDLRRSLGTAGQDLYRRCFTAARMTADTMAVYDQAMVESAARAKPPQH